jgi:SOS-response transcriptional repressor LexA
MTQTVADRILERLDALNLSARKAALRAGIPPARLRDVLNGKSRHPRSDTISALAPALEVTASWLAGEPISDYELAINRPEPSWQQHLSPLAVQRLPIRYRVQAGSWREVEDVSESYGVHDVPIAIRYQGFAQWLEEVVGDSLDKLILAGRLVHVIDAIDLGYSPADGDIVVVERRRAGLHERTLKQVEITGRRIMLWPRSNNPKWQEPLDVSLVLREVSDDIEVEIVGLVVADFKAWK